ncbi:hypothetical protein M2D07_006695 [Pseudomonas sp. BGr12]|uniref:hypothetical protein n=1 Tax=Pseudomonas sp. BGr12 TaxID=2936269 RepID=UPI00255A0C00|nr:hypothetical protein [Pseudomonas sp. BJa5]MDL2426703.1 hypothetical protein [Pseudomonas sp. BJa5]
MKKLAIILITIPLSTLASASDFATCLLDELPGAQNDNVAYAAAQVCGSKFPARYDGVAQGSGRGFFGYDSGAECALAKSKDTRSSRAAGMIRVACNKLYDKANFFDQFDASTAH